VNNTIMLLDVVFVSLFICFLCYVSVANDVCVCYGVKYSVTWWLRMHLAIHLLVTEVKVCNI
jgi:hypothetical protein